MDGTAVIGIVWQALELVLWLSAPPVLAAAIVGLIVSVLQAATQIQEQTVGLVPKLIAVYVALAVAGGWLLAQLLAFTRLLLLRIAEF